MSQFLLEIGLAIGGAVLGVVGQLLRKSAPRTVLTILGNLLLGAALTLAALDIGESWLWRTSEPSAYQLTRAAWTSTPTPTETRPFVPTFELTSDRTSEATSAALAPLPTATPEPTVIRPTPTPKPTKTPGPARTPRPTATRRLTATPRPTPEYRRLRLDRTWSSTGQQIQVVKLPSRDKSPILELPGAAKTNKLYSAAWSTTGDKVLVSMLWQSSKYDGGIALRVVDVASGNTRNLLSLPTSGFYRQIGNAIWSPDSSWIAFFLIDEANNGVYRINADGSGQQRLQHSVPGEWPRYWSQDGQWIVTITGDQQLWALEANGSRRVPLSSLGELPLYDLRYYKWRSVAQPKCTVQADSWWKCQ